jgi:hypothetical protein
MLVVVCGLPGVGKTTVAGMVADRFGAETLRTDVVREELIAEPTYTDEERDAVYGRCSTGRDGGSRAARTSFSTGRSSPSPRSTPPSTTPAVSPTSGDRWPHCSDTVVRRDLPVDRPGSAITRTTHDRTGTRTASAREGEPDRPVVGVEVREGVGWRRAVGESGGWSGRISDPLPGTTAYYFKPSDLDETRRSAVGGPDEQG